MQHIKLQFNWIYIPLIWSDLIDWLIDWGISIIMLYIYLPSLFLFLIVAGYWIAMALKCLAYWLLRCIHWVEMCGERAFCGASCKPLLGPISVCIWFRAVHGTLVCARLRASRIQVNIFTPRLKRKWGVSSSIRATLPPSRLIILLAYAIVTVGIAEVGSHQESSGQ